MNKTQKILYTIYIVAVFVIWIKGRIGCVDTVTYTGSCGLDAILYFIVDAVLLGVPTFILGWIWRSKKNK